MSCTHSTKGVQHVSHGNYIECSVCRVPHVKMHLYSILVMLIYIHIEVYKKTRIYVYMRICAHDYAYMCVAVDMYSCTLVYIM